MLDLPALVRYHPLYILLRVEQGVVFLLNSRQGVVRCGINISRLRANCSSRAYPEVTPAFLLSSLRKIHSFTLGFSPRPPVSVFRYRHLLFNLRGFSWKALQTNRLNRDSTFCRQSSFSLKRGFRIFLKTNSIGQQRQTIKALVFISFVAPSK